MSKGFFNVITYSFIGLDSYMKLNKESSSHVQSEQSNDADDLCFHILLVFGTIFWHNFNQYLFSNILYSFSCIKNNPNYFRLNNI